MTVRGVGLVETKSLLFEVVVGVVVGGFLWTIEVVAVVGCDGGIGYENRWWWWSRTRFSTSDG